MQKGGMTHPYLWVCFLLRLKGRSTHNHQASLKNEAEQKVRRKERWMFLIWMKPKTLQKWAVIGLSLKLISCPAEQEDWSHACAVGNPDCWVLTAKVIFWCYRNRRDETRQHRPDSAALGRAERKNWMVLVLKLSVFQQSAGESTCARQTSCCVRRSDFDQK